MRVRLSKTFHFDSAHSLACFPPGHKCRNLHGHSYRMEVFIEGDVSPAKGYLKDYGELKAAVDPIVRMLDHHNLNDIPGLEISTSENLAKWVWDRLKPVLPELSLIRLHETPASCCEYWGA